MAKTSKKVSTEFVAQVSGSFLKEVKMQPTTGIVGNGTFYSSIENRAPMIDLRQDLGLRFGVNRIMTQMIKEKPDETVDDKRIMGFENDKFDQIRMITSTENYAQGDPGGHGSVLLETSDYYEVTFYGTGLSLLTAFEASAQDVRVSVQGITSDGTPVSVGEGVNIMGGVGSNVLWNRRTTANQVVTCIDGLQLGLYTAKVRLNSANLLRVHGFEVLNDRTDILVPKGTYFINGKEVSHAQEESISYNSGFENEIGTNNNNGGHVSVYMDSNGQIKKDVRWSEATPQFLSNTDHSNEELSTRYFFREFGCQGTIDFSFIHTSAADIAYTLSDNTTTLQGVVRTGGVEGVVPDTNGSELIFTFVGTGLDIIADGYGAGTDVPIINIDGVNINSGGLSWAALTPNGGPDKPIRIASGLPYGTHVFRFTRNTGNGMPAVKMFNVYNSKKPEVPENSAELGSYNILADFVEDGLGRVNVSKGTIRRTSMREWKHEGTWSVVGPQSLTRPIGFSPQSSTSGGKSTLTFFGTGFDLRFGYNANINSTLILDGSSDFTSYTTSIYSPSGTMNFDTSTGIITDPNQSTSISGIAVSGLPLGFHTVTLQKNNTVASDVQALDVISPVHAQKYVGPYMQQHELRVGNQNISDSRKLASDSSQKLTGVHNWTTAYDTTQTIPRPQGAGIPFYCDKACKIRVKLEVWCYNNTAGSYAEAAIYFNGERQKFKTSNRERNSSGGNPVTQLQAETILNLEKGVHYIYPMTWAIVGGTMFISGDSRIMFEEI